MSDDSKMIENVCNLIQASELYASQRLVWLKKTTAPDIFARAVTYCEEHNIELNKLYFSNSDTDFKGYHKFSLPWIAIDILINRRTKNENDYTI